MFDDGVIDKIYWLLGKVICVHEIRSVTTVHVKVKGKIPEGRVLQRIECKKCGKVWYEERAKYSDDESIEK